MKISNFPNWIRWLLIPIAVVVLYIAVNLFFGSIWFLSSYLHGLDRDRLYVLVVENTIQPSAASFAVVFGAAYVSPTMKLGVAFVFGAAMTLISGFGLMSMLSTNNWWGVLNLIFSIAGSMIGIKVIFDEIKKQQAIEIPS
jgi:hypothetical protein